jgi:CheY-like chemotaxis protein
MRLPAGGQVSLTARPAGDALLVDVRAHSGEREESATQLSFRLTRPTDQPRRILVVDAAPALRRLMVIILAAAGHRVEAVATGTDALARLQQSPVDVVISDVWLDRRVTGLDLAGAVRERWPHVRFVVTTVSARDLASLEQQDLGIHGLLEKPFSPAGLRDVVAQLRPPDGSA